jgi:hypothetical protein
MDERWQGERRFEGSSSGTTPSCPISFCHQRVQLRPPPIVDYSEDGGDRTPLLDRACDLERRRRNATKTPSLTKEVLSFTPGRATSTASLQELSDPVTVPSTSLAASRDVAGARECPPVPKCTRLVPAKRRDFAIAGNSMSPFAGRLCKLSDGLEPSTPSLPCAPIGCDRLAPLMLHPELARKLVAVA